MSNEAISQEENIEQAPVQEQAQTPAKEETQAQAPQKKSAEYNWAEARKKMDAMEERNRRLEQEVEALKKPRDDDDDIGMKDDDIAEGKHLKSLKKEIKELKAHIKKQEASSIDDRLALKHPDFGDVVTRDNIEKLKAEEPELAASLSHITDPYSQGVAAYKMLKKLGIAQNVVEAPEKKKAEVNSQKPVSVNAVSKNSAIGNAHLFENGLTKELKQQLWKEMQDSMKRG